ncbi:hypothetical protein JHN63_43225 [Streptomyces sp. MBT65]|uniref:hypothetical protein n=1 Tax=Streptomyces sp. MBT65 TaxID=1488395 RepID=UPI00190C2327|nr:hypothetical protein [Streptomyces sp. MBT65]MBK3580485.1 hypothetical protein [Streptomyces sp. MBT65]
MSLFWRMLVSNAVVLAIATALLISPWGTVSSPVLLREALVIGGGLAAMLVVNGLLIRVGLAPVERLTKAMADANLPAPGTRARVSGNGELTLGHVQLRPDLIDRCLVAAGRTLTPDPTTVRRVR